MEHIPKYIGQDKPSILLELGIYMVKGDPLRISEHRDGVVSVVYRFSKNEGPEQAAEKNPGEPDRRFNSQRFIRNIRI